MGFYLDIVIVLADTFCFFVFFSTGATIGLSRLDVVQDEGGWLRCGQETEDRGNGGINGTSPRDFSFIN